jgi:hypothetical protein
VRDVVHGDIQIALGRQNADESSSGNKIQSIRAEAVRSGHPPAIEDSRAFRARNGLTLMEGCHRTCALYLLDPPSFELRTALVTDTMRWPVYDDPRLRVT